MNPARLRSLPLCLLIVLATRASAQEEEHRPGYAFLRQNEDWSMFEPRAGGDFFDPIKHMDLSDDGEVWLSVGGRVEARMETWRDFGFGPMNNASTVVSRGFLHGDLHVGDGFRLFVEGKTAQSTSRSLPGGRRPLDMDTFEAQQVFVDVVLPVGDDASLTLRPGRQELLFGAQRLLSPLPWGNVLRTWDGVSAVLKVGEWSITGFATYYVPVNKTEFNHRDRDQTLVGLYARHAHSKADGVELYAFGTGRDNVTVNGTAGNEQRQTFGLRKWGKVLERGDFEFEGAWQIGELGSQDIEAWFIATQLGFRPEDVAGKPRFWIGFDAASGDSAPGGEVGTFLAPFPLGHAYLGYIDIIGRSNVTDANVGCTVTLPAATSCELSYHAFRLLETNDALYNAGNAPVRTGFTSGDVGSEIDLLLKRGFGPHVATYAGYSHFFPGDAIAQSGPAEDTDFFYFGFGYTF